MKSHHLLIGLMVGIALCLHAQTNRYNTPNQEYTITTVVTGRVAPANGVTLRVKAGGKFRNATIIGNNTRVIVESEATMFDGCTFSGTFCNSSVYATNFGCSSNLSRQNLNWTYGDNKIKTTAKTQKYVARDKVNNKTSLNSLAAFCSNSSNVSVTFNGGFYTPVVDNDGNRGNNILTISKARNLTLTGGTLMQGLVLTDCSDVNVTGMNFVGQHAPHDFPPIYVNRKNLTGNYTAANCYSLSNNQYAACGLAPEGIYVKVSTGGESKNITISGCNFEMRANGVVTGTKGRTKNIHHITVQNCKFSHIYYQPVGFHGSYNVVDNIEADYCLQGFDFSSGTNNSVVRNSKFYNCANGPKQESIVTTDKGQYDSYANRVENCYYQLNESFRTVDVTRAIFYAAEGKDGDCFSMSNMTMDVTVSKAIQGIQCRAYGLKINNLKLSLTSPKMNYLFARNGKTSFVPKVELNGCEITTSTTLDAFAMSAMDMTLTGLTLQGKGSISDVAFRSLNSLTMAGCKFQLPCNYFTQMTPSVSMTNCTVSQVKRIAFYPANSGNATYQFRVIGSTINAANAIFWAANAANFHVVAQNNTFKAGTVLNYAQNVAKTNVAITGNNIQVTGKAAFTGMKTIASKVSTANFKVSGNKISKPASTSVTDYQGGNVNSRLFSSNTF